MGQEDERHRALERLNPVERDLLAMLGRGHTAKSIAGLKSLSEAAVNERFRSARRKTGITSSREIARLIVAQENRHDFIDLAAPSPGSTDIPRHVAQQSRRATFFRRWRLPMAASALLAIAFFVHQTSTPPAASNRRPLPPAAQAMFTPAAPSPDVMALHAEVSSGTPDPAWSPTTEATLSQAYTRATDASGAVASLDVTCNASLCEVVGVARPGLSATETDALMEAIQFPIVQEIISTQGLDLVVQSINSTRDESADERPGPVFVAYWRRAASL